MDQNPFGKLIVAQLVKEFLPICGTQTFITILDLRVSQWCLYRVLSSGI
jgi:hypothetical protein